MEKWSKKVAIVTGANSGNGFAILKRLAEQGVVVVGFDINIEAIKRLSEENSNLNIFSVLCDVTKDESVETAFKWVDVELGGVDILINNAGMLKDIGILEHDKPMSELAMNVEVNFTAIVRCARLAFKSMESRDTYGMIINMNSVLGHYVAPIKLVNAGVYPGTKHAVTATSEVMRRELIRMENHKVRVTSISPGLVQTNIFNNAAVNKDIMHNLMKNALTPEDIAATVTYLLQLPYSVNVNEITVRATGNEL